MSQALMNPCGYEGGGCCCEICSVAGEAEEAIVKACRMAAAAEREACAKIADDRAALVANEDNLGEVSSNSVDCEMIARAIRARK